MDAIIIAGGILAPVDTLYSTNPGGYKSLIDIGGKPMVQWVLDALGSAPSIESIVVVGLPDTGMLSCQKTFTSVQGGKDMLENIQCGVEELTRQKPEKRRVLIVSADVPAVTAEMIEWEIKTVQETQHDFYYNVIERKVMEETFPASKRSFYALKDIEVCGADINAVDTEFVMNPSPQTNKIIDARKNLYRQAAIVGLDTLLLLFFRLLSLKQAEAWLAKRLNINARALICPFAEMGMDVDKPYQLAIIRSHLSQKDQV